MAVAGCINAYDCAGCYLTTLQQLQSDNIGVAINYTAPSEYGRRQLDYIKYTDKCGCTCCLTGENELRIYATQGVIKNLTLTNDDTNEVVNVKWNDLFGSNRAYTMVRYKTGSYPTSITDGTLAVKETTQNQYATSGYNVSGLTDGTTYYFTAFAVSQDGTIIVVQNKSITTDFIKTVFDFGDWTNSIWTTADIQGTISKYTDRITFYNSSNYSSNYLSQYPINIDGTKDFLFEMKAYLPNTSSGYHFLTLNAIGQQNVYIGFRTRRESRGTLFCTINGNDYAGVSNPGTQDFFIRKEGNTLSMGRGGQTKYTTTLSFASQYYLFESVYRDTITIYTAKLTMWSSS